MKPPGGTTSGKERIRVERMLEWGLYGYGKWDFPTLHQGTLTGNFLFPPSCGGEHVRLGALGGVLGALGGAWGRLGYYD